MHYNLQLKNIFKSCVLTKIPADSHAFLASEISKNFSENDIVFIAKNDAEMEVLQQQLLFFNPTLPILLFPAWDCLPFDRASPKSLISSSRIKALHKLANRALGQKFFIITSINSLLQKIISKNEITSSGLFLQVGSKISIDQISEFLVLKGYRRESLASDVGEFATRGGIMDIVMQEAMEIVGYRLDFFGQELESIKTFDPVTQLSTENLRQIEILPASEVVLNQKTVENFRKNYRHNFGHSLNDNLYSAISEGRSHLGMEHFLPFFYDENLVSLFTYLQNPLCFFGDEIRQIAEQRSKLILEYYQMRADDSKVRDAQIYNPVKPDLLYFNDEEFFANLKKDVTTIEFKQFDYAGENERIIDLEFKPIPDFALAGRANKKDPLELLKEFYFANSASLNSAQNSSPKAKLLVACLSNSFKERLEKTFFDYQIPSTFINNFAEIEKIKPARAALFNMPTHFGFYNSDFFLVGQQALFGEKIARKKITSKDDAKRIIEEGLAINNGELVVHRDYGIGKFQGIFLIETSGIKIDMLKILYANDDALFVPVDDINLISRYGADNPLIQLDRLGAGAWKNRREKVRSRIKLAAEELMKVAAARQIKKAPIFAPQSEFYEEFKNRFGFIETDDQLRAINEVEEDLLKGSPMDRLICGDVGFGKTEVAMRAAAVVVSNNDENRNFQIAIVAPTTLLVRQHYKNFSERFSQSGVKIVQLSRLITPSKAKEIRAQIESGEAQIIIGTHALLQKTLKFKNLALVIIDEEQHFGVAQKERLKEMRNEVHIITLSATPIPRTLQMSLTGVKDLSLIATPPLDRLAVRNFVMPYDSVMVREAVMREYNRSGRVFFVVPRVRDIDEMEARLKILLPEIKIAHAHGQMPANQLDGIMNDFVDGKIDLLISTTIVESGIDIKEANLMIIYRADMFGLSQLYQLRGRVGRGKVRAYCYFMLDNRKRISDDTKKKLEVMQNLDALGVGFSIASHDMDIRGSGNLLGDEQSGHINETGVELYQQMLLEAIENLKNEPTVATNEEFSDYSIAIKLAISLLIPESYISDLALRMSFYKRIANISNAGEEENLIAELVDRFGKIPLEIFDLIKISNLKHSCAKVGISRLEMAGGGILISFKNDSFKNPDKLLALIFASKDRMKLSGNSKVLFLGKTNSKEEKFALAFAIIQQLEKLL